MKTKTSASVVARRISRILSTAGLERWNSDNPDCLEGFQTKRIGISRFVSIVWHIRYPSVITGDWLEDAGLRREEMNSRMTAIIREFGYCIDECGRVECGRE